MINYDLTINNNFLFILDCKYKSKNYEICGWRRKTANIFKTKPDRK